MSYSIEIDKDFYISRHQIFNEFNHCLHYANGSNNVFGRKRRADVNRFTYCFCYAILSSLCYHRVLGMKLTMWLTETDSFQHICDISSTMMSSRKTPGTGWRNGIETVWLIIWIQRIKKNYEAKIFCIFFLHIRTLGLAEEI